ncbi:hypothetical protein NDU88_009055 [Pleurodeles waltl]|uniref:Uncharacterized protein n=1 Tax=Pleurodeles waltl TaxID=8319 RepID=A0AAV7RV04_PLEWA|nr:hypothetical protein NDU88_009055 [Pleurodeles waltl]
MGADANEHTCNLVGVSRGTASAQPRLYYETSVPPYVRTRGAWYQTKGEPGWLSTVATPSHTKVKVACDAVVPVA